MTNDFSLRSEREEEYQRNLNHFERNGSASVGFHLVTEFHIVYMYF